MRDFSLLEKDAAEVIQLLEVKLADLVARNMNDALKRQRGGTKIDVVLGDEDAKNHC